MTPRVHADGAGRPHAVAECRHEQEGSTQIDDTLLSSARALLIQRNCPLGKEPWNESDSVMSEFYAGLTEKLQNLIDQQVARRAKYLATQKAEKG